MNLRTILLLTLILCNASPAGAAEAEPHEFQLPHSFLLPKSIPDAVGSYHLQLTPFLNKQDGASSTDLGAHASFGMFDWGGLHARTLGIKTVGTVELIGMVNLLRNEGRGLSLLAIGAVPTKSKPNDEHNHGLQYLFGVSARPISRTDMSLDCNLHYDFTAGHVIPEVGYVAAMGNGLYGTLDGTATLGEETRIELLSGIKYKLTHLGFVGFGYRFPISTNRAFDNQLILQFEVGSH